MKIVGQFLVQESFTITGAGFVIVGKLIEGDVGYGNHITINTDSGTLTLTIKWIDYADNISTGESRLGLRFSYVNEEQKKLLAGLKVSEQQVAVCADQS